MAKRRWEHPSEDDTTAWIAELRRRIHSLGNAIAVRDLQILKLPQAAKRKEAEVSQVISHTVIVVALIVGATTLAVTGGDATPVWSLLGGYLLGAVVGKGAATRDKA